MVEAYQDGGLPRTMLESTQLQLRYLLQGRRKKHLFANQWKNSELKYNKHTLSFTDLHGHLGSIKYKEDSEPAPLVILPGSPNGFTWARLCKAAG